MRQPDGRRSGVRAHRPGRKIPGAASHRAEDRVLLHGAGTARTPGRVLRRQDGARAQVILCARSGLASRACTDLIAAFSLGAKASPTTTCTCANTCSAWWATPSHRRGSRPSTGPGPTGGAPLKAAIGSDGSAPEGSTWQARFDQLARYSVRAHSHPLANPWCKPLRAGPNVQHIPGDQV